MNDTTTPAADEADESMTESSSFPREDLKPEERQFLIDLRRMTNAQLWKYIELVRRPEEETSPEEAEFIEALERYALKRTAGDGMPEA